MSIVRGTFAPVCLRPYIAPAASVGVPILTAAQRGGEGAGAPAIQSRAMGVARVHAALAIAVATAAIWAGTSAARAAPAEPVAPAASLAPAAETISVRLLGAVAASGFYKLPAGARLSDLFVAAGIRLPTDDPRDMPLADVAAATGACSTTRGDLRWISLTRKIGDTYAYYGFNLARAHDDPRLDPTIRDGDTVIVPECRRFGVIRQTAERLR